MCRRSGAETHIYAYLKGIKPSSGQILILGLRHVAQVLFRYNKVTVLSNISPKNVLYPKLPQTGLGLLDPESVNEPHAVQ
jgi:hypothetical protein